MSKSSAESSSGGSIAASSTSTISRSPMMINGFMFARIKRCCLCLRTNADPNPLSQGPFGLPQHELNTWAKGTQEKPEGKLDKLCQVAFLHGGFSAQYPDPEDFAEARKNDSALNMEWLAVRDEAVVRLENCTSQRLGKKVTEDMAAALIGAKKVVLTARKESTTKVRARYKLIAKDKFERKFPGKIEKDNLTVKTVNTSDKGLVDCVYMRQREEDEWSCDEEINNTVCQEEMIDDGENVLRQGQQQKIRCTCQVLVFE